MKGKTSTEKISLKKIQENNIPENVLADRTTALQELLEDKIKCLYWVENHLLVALPKMVTAAGTPELQKVFEQHLEVTREHVERLEKVFDLLDIPPIPKKSDALEGLTMDGEHCIEETTAGSDARTTGLIMAGQLVENFEITSYSGLVKLAGKLGLNDISDLLSQTLEEEQEAENSLSALAEA